jgi:hypothetical protein
MAIFTAHLKFTGATRCRIASTLLNTYAFRCFPHLVYADSSMQIMKRSLARFSLRREIVLALLLKFLLLFCLWWAFFSDAPDKSTIAISAPDRIAGAAHDFSSTPRRNSHD